MTQIDSDWIKRRLDPKKRGQKADLARAAGLTPNQLSYILSGQRRVALSEAPAIAAFFGEELALIPAEDTGTPRGMAEGARPFSPPAGSPEDFALMRAKANGKQPLMYQAQRDFLDFGVRQGDAVLVVTADKGQVGDLVACGVTDPSDHQPKTDIRLRLDPWLYGHGNPAQIDDDTGETVIYGKVCAVFRVDHQALG